MYFLYSKTPFGPYYHKKLLRKTRGKPPHRKAKTVDCGEAWLWRRQTRACLTCALLGLWYRLLRRAHRSIPQR